MPRLRLQSCLDTHARTLTAAADWPQLLGPARDGHSAETKLDWNWPKDGPPVVWKKDVGTGWAGPVVAGGRVYLFHRVGDEEILACLDPATGKEQWSFAVPDEVPRRLRLRQRAAGHAHRSRTGWSSPSAPTATSPRSNCATTARSVWHRNLRDDYKADKGFFGVACSPLVDRQEGARERRREGRGRGRVRRRDRQGAVEVDRRRRRVTRRPSRPRSTASSRRCSSRALGCACSTPRPARCAHELPVPPAAQRERAGRDAARVEGRDLPHGVVLDRRVLLVNAKGAELEEVWANDKSLSSQYNTPVRVGDYLYGVHGRADVGTARSCGASSGRRAR